MYPVKMAKKTLFTLQKSDGFEPDLLPGSGH
jgi:hypothetical protein